MVLPQNNRHFSCHPCLAMILIEAFSTRRSEHTDRNVELIWNQRFFSELIWRLSLGPPQSVSISYYIHNAKFQILLKRTCIGSVLTLIVHFPMVKTKLPGIFHRFNRYHYINSIYISKDVWWTVPGRMFSTLMVIFSIIDCIDWCLLITVWIMDNRSNSVGVKLRNAFLKVI